MTFRKVRACGGQNRDEFGYFPETWKERSHAIDI